MPYKEKIFGIYAIVRIGTTDCYVGQSVHIYNRWRQHRSMKFSGSASKLAAALAKYGINAFEFKILEVVKDPTDLQTAEQKWIDDLKPRYNIAPSSRSTFGLKFSDQARKNVSIAQKKRFEDEDQRRIAGDARRGKPSPWKGKTPTKEVRLKMSIAASSRAGNFTGHKHSEESLLKMRVVKLGKTSPNKGKPHSPEANLKQSLAMMGRTPWNKGRKIKELTQCPQAS